jgi:phosphopentomutase
MNFRRVILVVADSVGIGEMPDAARWGDAGAHTLGHTLAATGVRLPHLQALGLANITPLAHHPPASAPGGAFGKAAIASEGKDTTVGHWEMAGILTERPFPTYPHGFPPEVLAAFEARIGRGTLGNCPASGTEIIQQLGDEHVRTGRPIVYTSADSVFQIACHEAVVPVGELYAMCETARAILQGPHRVARVIARPFVGTSGAYTRTVRRKDFAVPPPEPNLFSLLEAAGRKVITVGKIASIFDWRHTGEEVHTKGNAEGIAVTRDLIAGGNGDFVMVNLVDFDMLYGHRNDPAGYAAALAELDAAIPGWLAALRETDLLILTADHGCDPTTPSTDHNREYVPILCAGPGVRPGADLGTRASLADMGQTAAEIFDLRLAHGESFLTEIAANSKQ